MDRVQGDWWRRKLAPKEGIAVVLLVAAGAFGALMVLAHVGLRPAPVAAAPLASAGEG